MFNRKKNLSATKFRFSFLTTFLKANDIHRFFFIILVLSLAETVSPQSLEWRELPGIPYTGGRYDDLYFVDANTGWVLGNGEVFKTTNSGVTWVSYNVIYSYRSIGFFDSMTGIIGALNASVPLIRTTNGGVNWTDVTNIQLPKPRGICGISIANENIAYACGAYFDSAKVLKTTDKGLTWTTVFNDTSMARTLVDCYFWSPDSGIAAGGYNVNSYATGNSVVILTTNGGDSWERVYKSSRTHEWCWKISFNPEISQTFGVVSIQRMNGLQSYYLKTTNKGFNWSEIPFMSYNEQGIGFLNENTGWIGGYGNSTAGDSSYQTTDGGLSWVTVSWSRYLNRIRFVNDTLAFASGHRISKYSRDIVSVEPAASVIPDKFNLYQNFPNPFNPKTIIKLDIPSSGQYGLSVGGNNNLIHVSLIVYDQIGKEITVLIDENLNPGSYKASFDGGYYPSGIYYYKLDVGSGINKYSQTKKMLMLK